MKQVDQSVVVDPPKASRPFRCYQYVLLLSCVAAIGGFLFGFDSGVINGTVDALAQSFGTKAAVTGFAVGSVLIGCAAGAFLAGTLADFLGRRPSMLINAILFLISAYATGMHTFGASAPLAELQRRYELEPERIVAAVRELCGR